MDKIKVIQYGVCHEHASGKIGTLRHLTDVFEVAGVVDDTGLEAAKFAGNLNDYRDFPVLQPEEAFSVPGLQAVFVEVPNEELVRVGTLCAERGLPMHLDKPAGESLAPYAKLLNICKEKNVPLQMGYMYRGNPAFQFCQKAVREGWIGEVCEIRMDMNHCYGGEAYQTYIAKFKGGIMYNLGCHLIDFIVSIMGRPSNVTSFLRSAPGEPDFCKNNCAAVLEYPHAFAMLNACSRDGSGTSGVSGRRLQIYGTNGIINLCPVERFDDIPSVLDLELKKPAGGYQAGHNAVDFGVRKDRYIEQLREFAAIIRGEMVNPYTYAHDYTVHEVTLAAAGYTKWNA